MENLFVVQIVILILRQKIMASIKQKYDIIICDWCQNKTRGQKYSETELNFCDNYCSENYFQKNGVEKMPKKKKKC